MQVTLSALLAAAFAAQATFATPIRSRTPYVVKETHAVPRGWTKVARSNGNGRIDLQIGLKQSNMQGLIKQLHEVSDPDHEQYGNHLSAAEVNELIKPTKETSDLVGEWLSDNDIDNVNYSPAKDWISISIPIEFAERLLNTEYNTYRHTDGSLLARAPSWSLPRHLVDHIDMIQPTSSFLRSVTNAATYMDLAPVVPAGYKPPTNQTIAAVCNVTLATPECFATLYDTKGYKPRVGNKNSIGFNNFLAEVPIRPDTELFLKKYRPEAVSQAYDFKTYSINGGPLNDGNLTAEELADTLSHEANLDVQTIAAISWPIPIVSYSTGGSPPFIPDTETPTDTNEPYLDWVNWLLSQHTIPPIVSTSYGDTEQSVPRSYAERVCNQLAIVGARGTTLFFSSGDQGVGNDDTCFSNDGKNTTKFTPAFPSTCPYVTTVGATMNFEPEESAYRAPGNYSGVIKGLYSSGSGFSNYFPRPAYQHAPVSQYLKSLGDAYEGLYNPAGRAYPDLSAQGLYFAFVWNGTEGRISGTSASTPLTAGIFSMINDALIASGKPTLGFLNPWLYKKGYKGLTDITKGFSHGCNVEGFPVTEGWDPVTGFGTPIFPELLSLAGAKL